MELEMKINNLRKDLSFMKQMEIKPNYKALGDKHGIDQRTVKKYHEGYEGKRVFQSKSEMFNWNFKGMRLGKYLDHKYYVYQQAFDDEVIKLGFNPKTIKKGFSERGYIEHNKGTYTKQTRDDNDRARYICVVEPNYIDDELEQELIINDILKEEHDTKYKVK